MHNTDMYPHSSVAKEVPVIISLLVAHACLDSRITLAVTSCSLGRPGGRAAHALCPPMPRVLVPLALAGLASPVALLLLCITGAATAARPSLLLFWCCRRRRRRRRPVLRRAGDQRRRRLPAATGATAAGAADTHPSVGLRCGQQGAGELGRVGVASWPLAALLRALDGACEDGGCALPSSDGFCQQSGWCNLCKVRTAR